MLTTQLPGARRHDPAPRPILQRATIWLVIGAAVALAALAALIAAPAPDLSFVPNQATHVSRPCSPAPDATGHRAQAFGVRLAAQGIACQTCAGAVLTALAAVDGVWCAPCACRATICTSITNPAWSASSA